MGVYCKVHFHLLNETKENNENLERTPEHNSLRRTYIIHSPGNAVFDRKKLSRDAVL